MPSFTAEVYVDASDFETDELIRALMGRKLHPADKVALAELMAQHAIDEDAVERATTELVNGRRVDALVWLERALPRVWIGALVR